MYFAQREKFLHSAAMSSLIILFICLSPRMFVRPLRIYGDFIEVERSLRTLLLRCLSGASVWWWLVWCFLLSFDEVSRLKPDILPSADLLICATVIVLVELQESILGCRFYIKTLRTRIWLLLVSLVTHFWPVDAAVFKAVIFFDLLRCLIMVG